jgi:hypothetical protein
MMRRRANTGRVLLAGLGLAAALPAAAEVQVAVNGGRVDLSARSAPLSDVLDRLARQTAMQVTYEGAPPRNLVTAALQSATPVQAVLSVLEGLGLNYALQLDRTGQHVRTLLLVSRTGGSPARTAGSPPEVTSPIRAPVPPPDEPDDDVMEEDEAPVEVRPERPERPGERMGRPGRPERPGVFEPGNPSGVPFPAPTAPAQAYPVSPFAPVVPNPGAGVLAPPPPQAPPPDPNPPSAQ